MRVSPALLACFSLVAISGLPSKAADSSEASSDSASTLEANLDASPQLAVDAAAATADVKAATPTFSRLLDGVLDQTPPPMLSAKAQPSEESAGAQIAQVEAVEEAIEDGTDAVEDAAEEADEAVDEALEDVEDALDASEEAVDDAVEVIPAEGDESEPEGESTPGLPVPAAPNNGLPGNEVPGDEVPGDEVPGAPPAEEGGEADGDEGAAEAPEEARVLVAEVDVVSTNERRPLNTELIDAVYRAVETIPGRTTTRSQLQEDINNVFSTGFFSNVRAEPEDTALGVKVTFFVEPNPVLTQVDVRGRQVLDDETVEEIFSPQYGDILNLRDFQNSVLDLNDWYEDNGYVLAQVTAAPQISDDGTVTLIVAEGEIESIDVRYITPDGETTDEEGNPIGGKTRDFIVTREFETEPGDVFQDDAIREDILRAVNLGIFEDIRLSLDPGDEDPRKVKLIVNIVERDTGSIGASLGFNLRGDLFGQLSYNEDNFGGNNQKLRTEGRVTTRGDFLFDVSFTDPWIAGDPFRTSYTASLFNRRATSLIFDNGPIDVDLPNGDTPRINRLGTGLSFGRPLDNGLSLSLGAQYERVVLLDSDSDVSPVDELGNQLTASSSGRDDLLTLQFGAVLDRRNNSAQPTSGSLFRLGTEQSVPLGNGNIFFNKLRGSYSQYVPVGFFGDTGRETIAFNVQGGTTIGEIPPYEAFSLGGGNSVRGFEEGAVGAGTSFLQGTVEYRFPLFSEFLGGALFADYGTDLGSGDSVPGDPAGVRGKPGSGFGYGAGVRVQTPLGALRLDYGLSDEGSRFHFGFGERF
ncbi:MAG: BamA/TamA family outer membrane protein [Cyanobacteria bacterium J06631_12]